MVLLAQRRDQLTLGGSVADRLVGLDDQHRGRAPVEAHLRHVLDGVDGWAVHELQHRRPHPAGNGERGVGGVVEGGEGGHKGGRRPLARDQPQHDLGDDPERPLGTDEQLGQRQPGDVLDPRAAQFHGRAVSQDDGEAEDVVRSDAVLHAAQAARVGGNVAADRADLVRRGVGRVPQVVLGRRRLHLGVHQSRLDDRGPGHRVDVDGGHPLGGDDQAAVHRGRPAREPRAGTAGHDRNPVRGREPHRGLHVLGRLGTHDRERRARVGIVRAVPTVLVHPSSIGEDTVVSDRGGEAENRASDSGIHRSSLVRSSHGRCVERLLCTISGPGPGDQLPATVLACA